MRKLTGWTVVGAAMLLAAGCARVETQLAVNYDPTVSFASYKTYRWMAEPERLTDGREDMDPAMRDCLTKAVDGILKEKGYTRKAADPTDFLVGYHIGIGKRLDARSMNAYYLYPPGWGWDYFRHARGLRPIEPGQPKIFLYDRGAVVVDIGRLIEGETHLIWRGSSNALLPEEIEVKRGQEWFDEGAKEILTQFPPNEDAESK